MGGMANDFDQETQGPKESSKGEQCSGIGGYMDYTQNPNKWSPCSVEDFTNYYNRIIDSQGSFCLAAATSPPVTPKPTTVSPCRPDRLSYCYAYVSYCARLEYIREYYCPK